MNMGFGHTIGILRFHGIPALGLCYNTLPMKQISPQFQEEYMDVGL